MSTIYLTGDKHGRYDHLKQQLLEAKTTLNDVVVILGDHGTLYYGGDQDQYKKKIVSKLPATFIMIRGNHDRRPSSPGYNHQRIEIDEPMYAGTFYKDPAYPNILYTDEYGWYRFGTKKVFVIGGAYSVDKFRRLEMQKLGFTTYHWFSDEQLSEQERKEAEKLILTNGCETFSVMSHTCPLGYTPAECFLPSVDQSTVDKTMEQWLDDICSQIEYDSWHCGHWHTDKTYGYFCFMYDDLIIFDQVEGLNESISE